MRLVRVDLLDLVDAFVERTVNRSSDCECTTDDSAQANKEAREGLVAHFAVDDLHRRDVLVLSELQPMASLLLQLTYEKKTPGMPPRAWMRSLWPSCSSVPP